MQGSGPPVIRFENVGMRYGMGAEVLSDVSFQLAPGSFHFLTGTPGAGFAGKPTSTRKSTGPG